MVIGITSIVGMTAMIRGFDESLRQTVREIGPNVIYLQRFGPLSFTNGAQFSENYVWKNVPELDMKTQTVRLFDAPGIGLEPNHDFLNDSETKV